MRSRTARMPGHGVGRRTAKKPLIGFIGQGFIGKHYADDFEKRGFSVVRYGLEPQYASNKEALKACGIVFIAVPTPTVPDGSGSVRFDDSIVSSALSLTKVGATVVIKSTVLPGTTATMQKKFPDRFIMHAPEFLTEKTAAYDAAHPVRNIIGIVEVTPRVKRKAREVLDMLPKAPFEKIMAAHEAELTKYAGNCLLYTKTIFINVLYDLALSLGADWENIKTAIIADPRIGSSHVDPVHSSGRGAGGHCFIKDFAAFVRFYESNVHDKPGSNMLKAIENKNVELLTKTGKDAVLLTNVYGKKTLNLHAKNRQS
jgi:nucleotide sugar dehydrogenase